MGVIEKFQPPAEKASDFFSWFSWLLLAYFRIYVAWVFRKSGMHKIGAWETTLVLFEYEYQVPLLNFELAAYLATFGELVLPVFLIVGLGTRYAALALSFVNIIAVVSYYATLAKGAGLVWHYLWGSMLLVNIVYGGGLASVDHFLKTRGFRSQQPITA